MCKQVGIVWPQVERASCLQIEATWQEVDKELVHGWGGQALGELELVWGLNGPGAF